MRKWFYKYFGTSCPRRKKGAFVLLTSKVTRFTIQIFRFYKQFIQKRALITCPHLWFFLPLLWAELLIFRNSPLSSPATTGWGPFPALKDFCVAALIWAKCLKNLIFFLCNIQTKLVFILVCLFAMCWKFQSSEVWDGTKPAPINSDTKDLTFFLNQVSEHNMVIWAK